MVRRKLRCSEYLARICRSRGSHDILGVPGRQKARTLPLMNALALTPTVDLPPKARRTSNRHARFPFVCSLYPL